MSYTVIIADDEPLVLAGLQSLIPWSETGFEISAQARNGGQLEELIRKEHPDLVITDIKMPVKSGLEVMNDLAAEEFPLPEFILLTSFEEFALVKEAISLGAVDYLVKLELNEENLKSSLSRAAERIQRKKARDDGQVRITGRQLLQDQFFIRQFFAIADEDIPVSEQISTLGLELDYQLFLVCILTFPTLIECQDKEKAISQYNGALRIYQETVSRYVHCYTVALDPGSAAMILCFTEAMKAGYRSYTVTAMSAAREGVRNFLSIPSYCAAGISIDNIRLLSESFSSGKAISSSCSETSPVLFAEYSEYRNARNKEEADFSLEREQLRKAFSEVNATALKEGIYDAARIMKEDGYSRIAAIDTASDILYMVMNLLPDGKEIPSRIFTSPSGYRILYQLGTSAEVASWLETLADGTAEILTERKQDYRLQIITRIQSYINENITRRLTLSEIASLFGYSQGYLSSLFSRYAGVSFVDYVTDCKIAKAKELMTSGETRIYEVAEKLGFESAFYFSKVFKKVTGISPSDYIASLHKEG